MKRMIMLPGIALCLICSVFTASAQQNNLIRGTFKTEVRESGKTVAASEARYSIDLQNPGDLVFMVTQDQPTTMSARIVNEKGTELARFSNAEAALRSYNKVDVSKMSKGNYFIEVFMGSAKQATTRLPFTL